MTTGPVPDNTPPSEEVTRSLGAGVGQTISHYRILERLGAGGMGVVYKAEDLRLGRLVAIKLLAPEIGTGGTPDTQMRRERFVQEAKAASALDHVNIANIHEIDETADGQIFIVMAYYEGESLKDRIGRGPLPLDEATAITDQVARGLSAAHAHGIVHRDIKPGNIMVTTEGVAKIIDFGLAKLENVASLTGAGTTLGTIAYMSPEQARGEAVDARTDLWSLGVVLYEMLTGHLPFRGEHQGSMIRSILEDSPEPVSRFRPDLPEQLQAVVRRALEKDPQRRYASADEIIGDLGNYRARVAAPFRGEPVMRRLARAARRPVVCVPALLVLIALGFWAYRLIEQRSRVRWVREQAIPEISRLLDSGEAKAAFRLMRRAEAILPDDPALKQIHHNSTLPASFRTNPPGAEVWATGYAPDDNDWVRLGTTPFTTKELLFGLYRFRIVKPGFQTILGSGQVIGGNTLEFDLDAEGTIPTEMVRVPGGTVSVYAAGTAKMSAFLIDRYEITNRQFKQFLDRGGYQKREYWKEEFVQDGRKLSWEEAMQVFRDSTGRPGPSTWEVGEYPQDQDDYPVGGVSWYEAAAYAAFAGKQLPTIYHWEQAASPGYFWDIAELSNYGGAGPARVGSYKGIGAFGTLDMAGNVKEWCWNAIGGQRYVRGGAWNQATWTFSSLDARLPWDRAAQNGIRCVRYDVGKESNLQAPVTRTLPDPGKETPVSDQVFQYYRSLYAYDPADLDSRVEGVDEDNPYWKREKVSFTAAYGGERVLGYLYLPKRAAPPYQTIVYAHPGMAGRLPSPQPGEERFFDFLVKGGRAFLLPVLKGQYQRRYTAPAAGPNATRDRLILASKDFRRSIDYLVSRPDLDRDRLGVFGASAGANLLPIYAVGEQRLRAAVLVNTGLFLNPALLPEVTPLNFLPRFQVPTLVGGGRSDFIFPLETSQRPLFRLLGAPEKDKQLISWDGGHGDIFGTNYRTVVKAALDWFDRYLGPVK
jgi:eukaryotic-like serine/threonine-protein kinase